MTKSDVSDDELREAAHDVIAAAELPSHADVVRARDFLRAAELARAWLTACESSERKRLTPFRSFVLGYLAALKDQV